MKRLLPSIFVVLTGCGYHFAGGAHDPLGPFTVEGSGPKVAYPAAMMAAEAGARAELGRAGALASPASKGTKGHAIVIEILRVDEASYGIALRDDLPLGRGLRVRVLGRAYVRATKGGPLPLLRDTGDRSTTEVIAAPASAQSAVAAREEAERRAGRRLGEVLVSSLLGYPEPGED